MDNEHEIVWWAKGGVLKGTSPERIRFLKTIVYELPSPIEPTVTAAGTFDNLPKEVRKDMERQPMFLGFQQAMAMMTEENKHIHYALEYCYFGHCEEEAYLNYYDQRCSVKDTIMLPKDKTYRIELIDTWNMTRETIAEAASGFVSGQKRQISTASQVWMVLAGVFDRDENRAILKRIREQGLPYKMTTPYMVHHYTEALCICGEYEEAGKVIRDYWGKMMLLGADTFWESFNPDDTEESPYGGTMANSYCHAWSCTPSMLLRTYPLLQYDKL